MPYDEKFQSTGSVWSPTRHADYASTDRTISIHGLRVEPDIYKSFRLRGISYFNPRAPCGARPVHLAFFLLTIDISIHGLRVEPDLSKRPC